MSRFELDGRMDPSRSDGGGVVVREKSFEFLARQVPMSPAGQMLPTLSIRRARTKQLWDELKAEAFGSFMIIIFGCGVVASWDVGGDRGGGDPFAKAVFSNTAWGIGVMFGAMVSFNTSGAFLNPALVLNAIINGDFPVRAGIYFMLAQTVGCFLGALVITLNFVVFADEPRLWNFYTTGPQNANVNFFQAGFNEFVGTAILSICVAAITNAKPAFDKFHVAGFVGISVFGIGNVFGPLSGYALNPARDFGCRLCYGLFSIIYGGEGNDMRSGVLQDGYWMIPIIAPFLGAVAGGLAHKHLIWHEE